MEQGKKRGCLGKIVRLCVVLLLIPVVACVGLVGFAEVLPHLPENIQRAVYEFQVPFEEVTVAEKEVDGGYYYQHLGEEEQRIYKEILQGVSRREDIVYVHTGDFETVNKVYDFLLYDRPDLFWCTGELETTYYPTYSELAVSYHCTEEERIAKEQQIKAETEKVLSQILPGCTSESTAEEFAEIAEYERIKYVFEYLVNTVDYVEDAPDNQNMYSALVGKQTVCAGYARAAQYLLMKMGIECIYVTGECTDGEPHAWNLVKCDGNWYQMDVTFGDPEHMRTEEGKALADSEIDYSYLCCTDEQIFRDRKTDGLVEYPACMLLDYNYYVLHGRYYESYEPQRVLNDINQNTYDGAGKFFCQFASDEVREQAYQDMEANLFDQAAQVFLDFHGLQSIEYYYVEDPVMNTIELYWNY